MQFTKTLAAALMLLPCAAAAQEIAVKSIPVATGSQFLLYPSEFTGLSSLTIALDDALADPFSNPAKGANIRENYFSTTPYYYSIGATSNLNGHATRTIPVGALVRRGSYFGGVSVAWQEMVRRPIQRCCTVFGEIDPNLLISSSLVSSVTVTENSTTRNNLYVVASGGKVLREGLSAGISVFLANLKGVEGVQLLYSQGDDVDQDGRMATYKAGLYQRWADGRTAELVAQYHTFSMSHAMVAFVWGEEDGWHSEKRLENDETNGVALRLAYTQPMAHGWRFGARVVGDWKTHPKIPNYDLMQIPRDPGNTGAYNVGLGLSRVIEKTTYAFEFIYEPIWSHTWANAVEDIIIDDEPTGVKAGDMTVENYFRFHNSIFRVGVRQAGSRLKFGLGLDLHLFRYRLNQEDFVQRSKRVLDEAWGEWTLSTGLGYDFTGFRLQYQSIITWGTGQPGIRQPGVGMNDRALNASFVVAPAGALDLLDARVWTHRLSLLIPLSE